MCKMLQKRIRRASRLQLIHSISLSFKGGKIPSSNRSFWYFVLSLYEIRKSTLQFSDAP